MKWLLLALGIATEVSSVTCMKLSGGFSKWLPSTLTFVFMGISLTISIFAPFHFDTSFLNFDKAPGSLILAHISVLHWKSSPYLLSYTRLSTVVLLLVFRNR